MKTIAVISGGLDSAVLLYHLLAAGDEVLAFSVNYGQRHVRELEQAAALARRRGLRHEIAELPGLARLFGANSLTAPDIAVPDGHYTDVSMKQTIVPNRNMILLAAAAGWAIAEGAGAVAYAAHAGDHTIYPDCREPFAAALDAALAQADWHPVRLLRPFITWSKSEIVRRGAELGVPFADTWSCYKGGQRHCGTCGTCTERREAFRLANVPDPTSYFAG
jgi:7-cyano-7-deazaguanine synthase